MRVATTGALLLIVGVMAAACFLDIDDTHGAGGTSSAAGSGATGGAPFGCGPETTCVMGTWVILTDTACPVGSKEVSLTACDSCACQAVGPGVCSLDGKLSACGQGSSVDFPKPNADKCFDIGTMSGVNVWTVLNGGHCDIVAASVASNTRKACELVPSGTCDAGGSCVRADLAAIACEELAGVSSCPAGLPFWAHVSTAPVAACTCDCNTCGDMSVTAYQHKACLGSSAVIGADGQCKESGLPQIHSVRTPPNKPISCTPRGRPDMATERLCCPAPL